MFTIELELPSGKKTRIRELNNREYLSIIKFCVNKDYYGLNDFFEKLYFTPDLDIFDKFYILLYIRKLFISSKLELVGKDEVNVSYSIDNILNILEQKYVDFDTEIIHDDIVVGVSIPNTLYFRSVDEIYSFIIKYIQYKDTKIDFTDLNTEEKEVLLDKLPTDIFNKLQTYIDNISADLFDLTLIDGNEQLEISELKVNMLGNGVIKFIALLFSSNLFSFYELYYYFTSIISPGSSDFFNLTYNEVNLLFKIHKERIQRENQELQKGAM